VTRGRVRRTWLLLALASALCGCGRREQLEACNIATSSCQESVYYAVIRLRGDGWDPFDGLPPIHTITLDQYRKQLIAEDAAAAKAQPAAAPKFDAWSTALQLLGLVTPTQSAGQASIESRVNNVAAFYSSATRKVTVIDRGAVHDDRADSQLLAHELVHALQDDELSSDIHGNTSDGAFTGTALIEGEAVLYEHLAGAEMDRQEPRQLEWHAYYQQWAQGLRDQVPSNTSPYYATQWFVYPFGADLLTNGWLRGGNAAVRKLAVNFPRREVDLMTAIDDEGYAGHAPALNCRVNPPSDTFAPVVYDRMGAMQLYVLLTAAGMEEPLAWELGKDWRDDLIWAFGDATAERVVVTWRIRMTDRNRVEAVVLAAGSRAYLRAEPIGHDVLIVGSNDDALLASWPGAKDCD
jgi:hypothetical protein